MPFMFLGCPPEPPGEGEGEGEGEPAAPGVVINEFLASNASGLEDEDGGYSDWLELYNAGNSTISLSGWSLTDDAEAARKWLLPARALPAGGYLVVFCSGKDRAPLAGELHASFQLDRGGEYLGLFGADGATPVSQFHPEYPEQTPDYSYGMADTPGQYGYFPAPTPGQVNDTSLWYRGFAGKPAFSAPRGFYDAAFTLSLSSEVPAATIRYTLDGSVPTVGKGQTYTGPISVDRNRVVRAAVFATDYVPSEVATKTYVFQASAAVRSLPVLSIVGDEEESLYEPNGIMAIVGGHYEPTGAPEFVWTADGQNDYNNPMQRGRDYERPVSVEYLPNNAKDGGFQADCGIRVHGGDALRASYMRGDDWSDFKYKFSFRLYFREEYGEQDLDYDLFGMEVDSFKNLVVRGGHNDYIDPFIKDELSRRLFGDMGHEYSHGAFVNVFVNGEYKSYYNLVEHYDEDYCRSWFGGKEDWDIIDQGGVVEGGAEVWDQLLDFVRTEDLTDDLAYQSVLDRLKVKNFIDYLILQLYVANCDWPDNNWRTAREQQGDTEFRMFVWDTENGYWPWYLEANGFEQFPFDQNGLNGQDVPLAWLYRGLKQNAQFRTAFGERIQKHFYDPGAALAYDNLFLRFEELRGILSGVLPNMDTFIRDNWFPQRTDILMGHFEAEGLR